MLYDYKDPHTRRGGKGPLAIRFKTGFKNTLCDVCQRPGWTKTDSDMDWDVHWADREWIWSIMITCISSSGSASITFERRELCRKDLMYRNVVKFKRALERAKKYELAAQFDNLRLPNDYVEEFRRRSHITWIMTIGSAQGKGIFLFKKLAEIREWRDAYKNSNTRMQRTTPTGQC